MDLNIKNFWLRVDLLRGKKTLKEVCNAIDVSEATIKSVRSRETIPSLDVVFKLSQYLHCTLDYLLTGRSENNCLNCTEKQLIENYRNCTEHMKICIESTARDGAKSNKPFELEQTNCKYA